MAFHWKEAKNMWKGEGIYHLTFVVTGRQPLLGQLALINHADWTGKTVSQFSAINGTNKGDISNQDNNTGRQNSSTNSQAENAGSQNRESGPVHQYSDCIPKLVDADGNMAKVNLSPLGFAISNDLNHFEQHHPGMKLVAKMVMPDHIHIVVWVQQEGLQTIRQVGHGIRMGITHLAEQLGVWPMNRCNQPAAVPHLNNNATTIIPSTCNATTFSPGGSTSISSSVGSPEACHASAVQQSAHAGLILDQPFIRTLSRKGQLRALCQYVHDNAYRRWMKQQHPELFSLHRNTLFAGLRFRSMGNHWLLDWPERQMVECSRSIRPEVLTRLETQILAHAEQGAVTYSAAISEGERQIVRKLRESGYPVVILLKDGFPPAGSEQEHFYKPGGIYFENCLGGKLLLLEAQEATYEADCVTSATEKQLQGKAADRHLSYQPIAHSSLRWRYIAGNEIIRILADQ